MTSIRYNIARHNTRVSKLKNNKKNTSNQTDVPQLIAPKPGDTRGKTHHFFL